MQWKELESHRFATAPIIRLGSHDSSLPREILFYTTTSATGVAWRQLIAKCKAGWGPSSEKDLFRSGGVSHQTQVNFSTNLGENNLEQQTFVPVSTRSMEAHGHGRPTHPHLPLHRAKRRFFNQSGHAVEGGEHRLSRDLPCPT